MLLMIVMRTSAMKKVTELNSYHVCLGELDTSAKQRHNSSIMDKFR